MPSTGLGQRRTILIYSEPHPRALMRNLRMFTSRRRGSPEVPRALRGTPTAPACPQATSGGLDVSSQGRGHSRGPFPPNPPRHGTP